MLCVQSRSSWTFVICELLCMYGQENTYADDNTFIYCRFLNLHELGTSDICSRDFANVMFCFYVHLYTITIFYDLKDTGETHENKRLTKMKECTVRAEI